MNNYQARGYVKYACDSLNRTELALTAEQRQKLIALLMYAFDDMTEDQADCYDDEH